MSKKVYYRQCRMRKNYENGTYSEQVSYIPEPFCQKDRVLKLRDSEGVWDNGWVVETVSESRHSDDELPDVHKTLRGHRAQTGDSEKWTK